MKKSKGIIISVLIILLVFVSTIAATYSVIINVVSNNGINEIVNVITIRDLMTDNNGVYNDTYYNVKNELGISESEAEILMESDELNKSLQVVLNSIVAYKVDNDENAKMSDAELYNLIIDAVNRDNTISDELKDKVKNKSNVYIRDVSDFMYDIEVSVLENK